MLKLLNNQKLRKIWRQILVPFFIMALYPTIALAGQTDATKVVPEPSLSLPVPGVTYNDPAFGTPTVRLLDAKASGYGMMVPFYSQLQAWNADMTMILVFTTSMGYTILDAQNFQKLHDVDFDYPAWGGGFRWSPTEPTLLYYTGGDCTSGIGCKADDDGQQCSDPVLRRYRLARQGNTVTARRELLSCFTEYSEILRDQSFEELSDDGRYIALVGRRKDNGRFDIFSFDVLSKQKGSAASFNTDPDWAGMSPSGQHVVVNWGVPVYLSPAPAYREDGRYQGVEAFLRNTMAYAGKVAVASGHGDLGKDPQGNDVYVQTYANTQRFLGDSHYIVMSRIPDGIIYDSAGRVNETVTLGQKHTVPLLKVDWEHNMHISCRNKVGQFCAVSIYIADSGNANGWQPFEREIFKIYLDSLDTSPHVDRLAHHRSKPYAYNSDSCSNLNYFAQPHATVKPDGSQIIYGSNWGRICDLTDPVDPMILTISSGGPPSDIIAPKSPSGLQVK